VLDGIEKEKCSISIKICAPAGCSPSERKECVRSRWSSFCARLSAIYGAPYFAVGKAELPGVFTFHPPYRLRNHIFTLIRDILTMARLSRFKAHQDYFSLFEYTSTSGCSNELVIKGFPSSNSSL
jgi:hypothetical protein